MIGVHDYCSEGSIANRHSALYRYPSKAIGHRLKRVESSIVLSSFGSWRWDVLTFTQHICCYHQGKVNYEAALTTFMGDLDALVLAKKVWGGRLLQ